jgi:hypothetical protein
MRDKTLTVSHERRQEVPLGHKGLDQACYYVLTYLMRKCMENLCYGPYVIQFDFQ